MIGFLNVYKPSGITSNAVVQKIKKKFHIDKIGHMGTLDPLACGILPIAIGKATRLFDYSLDKKKRYTAIFDFGYTTDTLDIEGEKSKENGVVPTIDQIEDSFKHLIGEYEQIPPIYSAKCVNGRRAYDLARAGIDFELKPQKVIIYNIEILEKVSDFQYKFDIECSSGTYIRAIARDIAELCGTYGCMSYLERTETGVFKKDSSVKLEDLMNYDNCEKFLISPLEAFANFALCNIDEKIKIDLLNGKKQKWNAFEKPTFVVCNNELLGVARCNCNELILDTFLYEKKEENND